MRRRRHSTRSPATACSTRPSKEWANLLLPLMPPAPVSIVDFGCGTGSLAVLLALAGYQLRGLDLSDRMVAAATHKAASSGVRL